MKRRRWVVLVVAIGVAGAFAWPTRTGPVPKHLKPDPNAFSSENAPEGSPRRVHGKAYDEAFGLCIVVEQHGGNAAAIDRLLVLSRYTGYESVRALACTGLGLARNNPELRDRIVDRLAECLRDPEGAVQICACFALADQNATHKTGAVVPLLDSRNENVRRAAAKCLERLGVERPTTGIPK